MDVNSAAGDIHHQNIPLPVCAVSPDVALNKRNSYRSMLRPAFSMCASTLIV